MNAAGLLEHYERIADAPDAVAKLRRLILDLAVRGKLVPQNPSDEPASKLLQKIGFEKSRLARLGFIKPEKTSPGVVEAPFNLPNGWALCRWNSIAMKIGDIDHKMPETVDDGIPYVSPRDFYPDNCIDFEGAKRIARSDYLRLAAKIKPDVGDLIYPRYGTIGENRLVTVQRDFLASYSCAVVKVLHGFVDAKYQYVFSISDFCKAQAKAAENKTTQANVGISSIQQFVVPLPPLAEQHRIVAKFDELMALCDQLEAARAEREARRDRLAAASLARLDVPDPETFHEDARFALDALPALTARRDQIKLLRQTIFNLAVRGKLVPQDPRDAPVAKAFRYLQIPYAMEGPFDLPMSWAWASVGSVAQTRLGKMLDKAKNKGTPRQYLRNINVRWFDFDLSDLFEMKFEDAELAEFTLRSGDVLICEGGEPGRAAVWDERAKDVFFQKALHRVRLCSDIDPTYFVINLRASADDGRLVESFTGTGIKHFTGRSLDAYVFPVPPIAEQHRIVAMVQKLMTICDGLQENLDGCDAIRTTLLDALMQNALAFTIELEAAA